MSCWTLAPDTMLIRHVLVYQNTYPECPGTQCWQTDLKCGQQSCCKWFVFWHILFNYININAYNWKRGGHWEWFVSDGADFETYGWTFAKQKHKRDCFQNIWPRPEGRRRQGYCCVFLCVEHVFVLKANMQYTNVNIHDFQFQYNRNVQRTII